MNEENILQRLRRLLPLQDCFGPVSQQEIDQAERLLGVSFPVSYGVFLRHFGASLAFPPYEIAGLPPTKGNDAEPPMWSNVISDTEILRRVSRGDLPRQYLAISDDGADCKYYLDTAVVNHEGECPVIALGPGRDAEVVASSFVEFVETIASME